MADNVEEICSVGDCLSETPKGWIDRWAHNACFFYDSVAAARKIAEIAPRGFEIFAYRVLDRRFEVEGEHDIVLPAVSPEPLSSDWRMIGYDAVECTQGLESGAPVECSPLSCNGLSRAEAQARIAAQASREERLAAADVVIDNTGDLAGLRAQVDALWSHLIDR